MAYKFPITNLGKNKDVRSDAYGNMIPGEDEQREIKKLTFAGAVQAEYDGSQPVTVTIPESFPEGQAGQAMVHNGTAFAPTDGYAYKTPGSGVTVTWDGDPTGKPHWGITEEFNYTVVHDDPIDNLIGKTIEVTSENTGVHEYVIDSEYTWEDLFEFLPEGASPDDRFYGSSETSFLAIAVIHNTFTIEAEDFEVQVIRGVGFDKAYGTFTSKLITGTPPQTVPFDPDYVPLEMNPTLSGTEDTLTGLQFGQTKYKIGGNQHLYRHVVNLRTNKLNSYDNDTITAYSIFYTNFATPISTFRAFTDLVFNERVGDSHSTISTTGYVKTNNSPSKDYVIIGYDLYYNESDDNNRLSYLMIRDDSIVYHSVYASNVNTITDTVTQIY